MRPQLQVLVATMNQMGFSLVDSMALRCDAIIANQAQDSSRDEISLDNGSRIIMVTTPTRGVGLNRNIALDAAEATVCLLADDDVVYHSDYVETVLRAFRDQPEADVIFFNLAAPGQELYRIPKPGKVSWWNFLRYGTARVAIRLDAVRKAGISFSTEFGGGTVHSHGEDTLFFAQCLRQGLRLYAVPDEIGTLTDDRPSSWDQGYDRKYVSDQGALYREMSPRWWWLWAAQDAIRRSRRQYGMPVHKAFILMMRR